MTTSIRSIAQTICSARAAVAAAAVAGAGAIARVALPAIDTYVRENPWTALNLTLTGAIGIAGAWYMGRTIQPLPQLQPPRGNEASPPLNEGTLADQARMLAGYARSHQAAAAAGPAAPRVRRDADLEAAIAASLRASPRRANPLAAAPPSPPPGQDLDVVEAKNMEDPEEKVRSSRSDLGQEIADLEAAQTIRDICEFPESSPAQIVAALKEALPTMNYSGQGALLALLNLEISNEEKIRIVIENLG